MYETASPSELSDALRSGEPTLIDVRTPAEFREVHVRGACNVPLDRLQPDEYKSHEGQLYVICKSGSRGAKACERLISAGVENVVNVEGGTLACKSSGLPVVMGKKTISLERQVRIAAGSLIVIGTTLGAFVNPYWLSLAGFVGAGLVFAGVTDTCGMGMMLSKMPWNQIGSSCESNTSDAPPSPAA